MTHRTICDTMAARTTPMKKGKSLLRTVAAPPSLSTARRIAQAMSRLPQMLTDHSIIMRDPPRMMPIG